MYNSHIIDTKYSKISILMGCTKCWIFPDPVTFFGEMMVIAYFCAHYMYMYMYVVSNKNLHLLNIESQKVLSKLHVHTCTLDGTCGTIIVHLHVYTCKI